MDSNVMPCGEAQARLPDYLAGELTPSERYLLGRHLAICPGCRTGLEAQAALQARLRAALQARAAHAAPKPAAAQRLVASLPQRRARGAGRAAPAHTFTIKGAQRMNMRIAASILTALAISASSALAAPLVRAKVGAALKTGWHAAVEAVNGDTELTARGRVKAMFPTYLPAGGTWRAEVTSSSSGQTRLKFTRGDEFAILTLSPLSAEGKVNADQAVLVNGQAASLEAGLAGSLDAGWQEALWGWLSGTFASVDTAAESGAALEYRDGRRLTWTAGEAQAQLLSNLSLEEMIKVAESLRAAAEFEGELEAALPQLRAEAEAEAEVEAAGAAAAETEAEVEAEASALVEGLSETGAATAVEIETEANAAVNAALEAAAEAAAEVEGALEVETDVEVEGEASGGLPLGLP